VSDDENPQQPEEVEDNRPDDGTISDSATCPECGAPVENLRATCPNCGYEYKKGDYDDPEAGDEFRTGSQIDDEGNEQPEAEEDTDE
jgi:rubredoxin